jgi:hypothetical protein
VGDGKSLQQAEVSKWDASLEGESMVAMMQAVQRFSVPILAIGLVTGLLALIPKVGWILGFAAFMLAYRCVQRQTFIADLLILMAIWIGIRAVFMQIGLV